jgi:hypothetical protein
MARYLAVSSAPSTRATKWKGADGVEIRPYTPDLETPVKAFNLRLREGMSAERFPESHIPRFPKMEGTSLYQELFLVLHQGEVHGGYMLTHNVFALRGEQTSVACGPQFNLSEGIINRAFGMVGVFQVQDALRRQPLMYALGIGGMHEPQAELLRAMRWTLYPVPFYFKVLNASQLFANLTYIRNHKARMALDCARCSLVGPLAIRAAQARISRTDRSVRAQSVTEFGPWADAAWEKCKGEYSLIGLRDASTLNALYPRSEPRFFRLRVSHEGQDIGWVVLLDTQMSGHKQFGNMRVGSIVDCLAVWGHACGVVQCASKFLEERRVDIIVSNQVNSDWRKALIRAGYVRGPSNFILGLSQMLAEKLHPLETTRQGVHMTRGDGDGPIHL